MMISQELTPIKRLRAFPVYTLMMTLSLSACVEQERGTLADPPPLTVDQELSAADQGLVDGGMEQDQSLISADFEIEDMLSARDSTVVGLDLMVSDMPEADLSVPDMMTQVDQSPPDMNVNVECGFEIALQGYSDRSFHHQAEPTLM